MDGNLVNLRQGGTQELSKWVATRLSRLENAECGGVNSVTVCGPPFML